MSCGDILADREAEGAALESLAGSKWPYGDGDVIILVEMKAPVIEVCKSHIDVSQRGRRRADFELA
jgi:hypothetical protein